jgi:hypothetical protein
MASVYPKRGIWYLRFKDGLGRWQCKASVAHTKTEAMRLALELERRSERQRLGLVAGDVQRPPAVARAERRHGPGSFCRCPDRGAAA